MSPTPTPIIELQRRLTLVGEIRIGGEKRPKAPGAKLSAFRLTSASRTLIEQASKLYGGDVTPWESPSGPKFQVYTQAAELPVLVMPGYSLEQRYELWEGATKLERVCDGLEELKTGGACICAQQGDVRCDVYTRLIVALLELETAQGWRLITRGANAAQELPTMMRLVETIGGGSTFVRARLRVEERRGVKDGQVVRYVVPSLDLASGYAALAAGAPRMLAEASESGPKTIEQERSSAQTFAVEAAVGGGTERSPQIDSRAAEFGPFTPPPNVPGFERASAPAIELKPNAPATGARELPRDEQAIVDEIESTFDATEIVPDEPQPRDQTKLATPAMKKKLDVLVGKLRDAGHITTDGLYAAVATKLRDITPRDLVRQVENAADANGVLHWAPLRETLTRPEANQLIDWLEIKQQRVESGRA